MKQLTLTKSVALAALTLSSVIGYAYDDDKEKEKCRNPKIQEFTLPVYEAPDNKEVAPEAEFSFVVSGWANPKKIKLSIKDIDIPFTVKSTETFHKVNSKLPAEFTGKYVRINARIPAVLGCYSTIGWLIKVADKATQIAPQEPVASQSETPSAAAPHPQTTPSPSVTPSTPENSTPAPKESTAPTEKQTTSP
jgi:hypothetical protein